MRAVLHGLSLVLPLLALGWLSTGPHGLVGCALGVLSIGILVGSDALAPDERRMPVSALPSWVFESVLWVLLALHLLCIAMLPVHVAAAGVSLSSLVAVFLVGHVSAQGIVLAHELVHRSSAAHRLGGRAMLVGVLYEHFYTEHVRGHHRLVGTPEDPATARHGERFWSFLRRTIPGQFRSAWALEVRRTGAVGMFDRRQLGNRVLHGLVAGWALVGLVAVTLGPVAALAHVGQASIAVLMLEAVNFVEHWGLTRQGHRVRPVDSWDSEGAMTYYMLIGLARHGDHHAHADRPWQNLRPFEETPKMPFGYMAMVYGTLFADRWLTGRMDTQLRTRQLGPYSVG